MISLRVCALGLCGAAGTFFAVSAITHDHNLASVAFARHAT